MGWLEIAGMGTRSHGMIDPTELLTLLRDNGTTILAPLAVLEGPVVSVAAGWLASVGIMSLTKAYVILVLADLLGDWIWYMVGRFALTSLPLRYRWKLGLTTRRLTGFRRDFRASGGKFLLIGKLTHAAGLPVLIAAGAARMAMPEFLLFNLLGTMPKTALFLMIGYLGGNILNIQSWIGYATVPLLVVTAMLVYRRWGRAVS